MTSREARAVAERDALRRRFPQLPPWRPPDAPSETAATMASVFAAVSERDLLAYVLQTARLHGWRCYHSWNSRHSEAGFPDVVCVRPPRLLVCELKREGRYPTPLQRVWLADFGAVPGVEVAVWRPSDRNTIAAVLAAPERG